MIKSEDIALLELIKNAYDADASYCLVEMTDVSDKDKGRIVIEDDGCGMDIALIRNVWLEIGTSYKKELASRPETQRTPKYHRMRLGEKGIGRFGVHRLGNRIVLVSKAASSDQEVRLEIDWREAERAETIGDIPVTLECRIPERFLDGKTGTRIEVSSLKNDWTRGMARNVARAIASLNSPFQDSSDFRPRLSIIGERGERQWLEGLSRFEDIKDLALYSFDISVSGTRIQKFSYHFTPWKTMTKLVPRSVEWDSGKTDARLTTGQNDEEIDLSDTGPVTFCGIVFDRDPNILSLGVSDKSGFKKYLDENGGVRVYRDNMRVLNYGEKGEDWLELNLRRVNRPGEKISQNVIIGSVCIERESSSALIEKANREGFVQNRAFEMLKAAILCCIEKFEAERNLDKKAIRESYGSRSQNRPIHDSIQELKNEVESMVADPEAKHRLLSCVSRVQSEYDRFSDILIRSAGAGLNLTMVIHQMEKIVKNLSAQLKSGPVLSTAIPSIEKQVGDLARLIEGYSILVRNAKRKKQDLVPLIDQSLFNVEFRLVAHGIEVVPAFRNRGPIPAVCTINHVISMLLNLFDNSIWWLGYAKISHPKIYISACEHESHPDSVLLVFADNGPGFSHQPPEDLVEPFVSFKPGGMGIGLHLTDQIMKALGGRLLFPDPDMFDMPEPFKAGAIVALAFPKEM